MSAFVNSTITVAGILAAARSLTGGTITFTKIVMGDGFLSEGQTMQTVEKVISPKVTMDVVRRVVADANTAVLGGIFTNADLEEGFYWRELGLYADDPEDGEILFSYANSGEFCDYLPAVGGSTAIEMNVDVSTYVGNAANVKIYIAPDAYPTKADFDALEDKVNIVISLAEEAKRIAQEALRIAQEALAKVLEFGKIVQENTSMVQTVWDALFANVTANPWRLNFIDLDDITLTSGIWNKSQSMLEC